VATSRPIESVYREVSRAALLGLVINLFLGLTKLIGGIMANSYALISDSVNSLGDVFTSTVVLVAYKVAQQPPDKEHPYGHTRAEAIAASNVALVVIISALWVAWEAIRHITIPHEIPPSWTLWIAGVNVVIKEILYQYKIRVGRRTKSTAILANAWDHRSDGLCSLAVLVGLGMIRWRGPDFGLADEIASLFVVAVILVSGVVLFRKSFNELMDVQAEDPFVQDVRRAAGEVAGVLGVEKLRIRKTGLEYLADIHIEVDPNLTVAEGHNIGHTVKDHLLNRFANLRDVLVHLEPHPHDRNPSRPPAQ
jgi:cation diffusion facilitator family transporter